MKLSIIIVNYNTREFVRACIESIITNTHELTYEIVVVDNNSVDGSQQMIRNNFPEVLLLCNQENLGFSRANNLGVENSKGNYLLFLNSDTLVLKDALIKMVDYLKKNQNVGVVGPKILTRENQPTRSFMRFMAVKNLFLGSKYLGFILNNQKYRIHYPRYDYNSIQEVHWLSGACLMIQRDIFLKIGRFDENYFMYLEDMDLCLQVNKLGYRVVFIPSASICHLFGGSSSSAKHDKKTLTYKNSLRYYFKKNFSITHYWIANLYIQFFLKV